MTEGFCAATSEWCRRILAETQASLGLALAGFDGTTKSLILWTFLSQAFALLSLSLALLSDGGSGAVVR
jgi:hypothetical protein